MKLNELENEVKRMMENGEKLHGIALEIAMEMALREMEENNEREEK